TSDYADTSGVAENTLQIMIDYLAAGLDPAKSVLFLQSSVPEHAELHLLLSMVTPLGWLERVPSYKEALENVKDKNLHTYGFLGYPILQCADIVIYSQEGTPLYVPVGEDQKPHVELSREIVRRFNFFWGKKPEGEHSQERHVRAVPDLGAIFDLPPGEYSYSKDEGVQIELYEDAASEKIREYVSKHCVSVLEEPAALLTSSPRIPGLDGRKMSKSYGNAITLSESDADIRAKTKVMV